MHCWSLTIALALTAVLPAFAQYAGSEACRPCHAAKFESQSKTAHAKALAPAPAEKEARPANPAPPRPAQWAFGAGEKAITWVSQTGEETIAEHGLSWYASTKALGITPGHKNSDDIVYSTFDAVATALRCFRCHSTGPVTLGAAYKVQPSEPGIHCEACHGPGLAHIKSAGAAHTIQNPRRLTATQINQLCGACHRQASDLDDDTDWTNAWNIRHQPSYLHRAACFRNSKGALSCVTCHDPHQPLVKTPASYDARCIACHAKVIHKIAVASRACVTCHMPQVRASATLEFTNHWIGIYTQPGEKLIPSRRIVKTLAPAPQEDATQFIIPADPSTLIPVFEKALADRENESGPNSENAARASRNLGLFLLKVGKPEPAESALRRALAIDESSRVATLDADRENLALALEAEGKRDAAASLYRAAAEGNDPKVSARSFAKLAEIDADHADSWYRNAIAAEEKISNGESQRMAALLHEYALALRARNDDSAAEPALRRALAIQSKLSKPDYRLTVGILNTLGNLLEGGHQFPEAEKLERAALDISEQRFGPESAELALTCTNLADVLWNEKRLDAAGQLYRRAIAVDASLYGPEQPETAADIANLGMLMKEAGERGQADSLLRHALAIYEKTLGPASEQAQFVRKAIGDNPR